MLLVVTLVGVVYWRSEANRIQNNDLIQSDSGSSKSQTNTYLVIEEWGIKIRLINALKDLKYTISDDGKSIVLTSSSLSSVKGCENAALQSIERAREGEAIGATIANKNSIPPAVKLMDYYYLTQSPSFSCSSADDLDGQAKEKKIKEGVRTILKNMELN